MNESEITGPVYPLSRDAFGRALVTGHGRGLIHAEESDAFMFREGILEAASRCLGYDPQVDG